MVAVRIIIVIIIIIITIIIVTKGVEEMNVIIMTWSVFWAVRMCRSRLYSITTPKGGP